ncbi:Glutamine amidotransferase, CobB/CobQ family, partial [human gut metagenome]
EGCIYKNTFGSYFHGSFLSKNPEFADRLLTLALQKKYGQEVILESLKDEFELKAKQSIIERLKK